MLATPTLARPGSAAVPPGGGAGFAERQELLENVSTFCDATRRAMIDCPIQSSKRVLEPIDRVPEVLFGLIMVLTFTGSLGVAGAGRPEIRIMLVGALGCNLAWGIIDAILYLMGCLAEQGRSVLAFCAVRKAPDLQKSPATSGRCVAIHGCVPPAASRARCNLPAIESTA